MCRVSGREIVRALVAGKVPYVITLLIGLLGYTVQHAADRAASVPIVEYRCTAAPASPLRANCEILNPDSAAFALLKRWS
jgi:hypothetical protein